MINLRVPIFFHSISPLDPRFRLERVELREVMSMLRDTGITTVVVDHDVSFVSSSCSRVFAMASGAPIGIGTPQEVLAMPELIQSYLGG